MKMFLLLLLLFAGSAFAQDKAPVPDLVFSQQVNIVVSLKKDPRIFDVKIQQKQDNIHLDLIVDKNVDQTQAKTMAANAVMLTKGLSLDDPPKDDKKPGKGLYNYAVAVAWPDGVTLITAAKPKDKDALSFEDQFQSHPLTRADAAGQ